MAILFQDDFAIPAVSLGTGWTEDVGNFGTNASESGIAVINATGISLATADDSSQVDQYVQCFCKVPDADNNAGIAWRIADSNNYYYLIFNTGTNALSVGKNEATSFSIIQSASLSFSAATWYRIGIQMIADQISVYLDEVYQTNTGVGLGAGEGPQLQFTDSTHTAAGKAGIISVGNDLTDLAGPLWNDFICHDGAIETIYVDTSASSPDAFGTATSPDFNIDWAFNNVGLVTGGTVKILNTGGTPITNGVGKYKIGHAGKFAGVGSFPTYSDLTGEQLTPGAPNLIIEGADNVSMTIVRETQSAPLFDLRGDCSWILFQGLVFEMTGGASSTFIRNVTTNQLGASVEHSFRVVKSTLKGGNAGLNDTESIIVTQDATSVGLELCYCLSSATTFISSTIRVDDFAVDSVSIRRCIFDGAARQHVDLVGGPAAGMLWDIDHCDFIDYEAAASINIAVAVADGTKVIGDVEIQNSLCRASGAELGFAVVGGAVAGSVGAHHCGFFGLVLNLSDVDDDGNNVTTDPTFVDEAASLDWDQATVFPSGSPIVLPSNWKSDSSDYIDAADDAFLGVVFDIGALESSTSPPFLDTYPVIDAEASPVAETIDVIARWIRRTDGTVIQEPDRRLEDRVFKNHLHTTVTLAGADANIQIPFGQGFTTAVYNFIKVGPGAAITYSVDGTATHHRLEAGGMDLWVGSITSLYLTNLSATESVDVEIALAGD